MEVIFFCLECLTLGGAHLTHHNTRTAAYRTPAQFQLSNEPSQVLENCCVCTFVSVLGDGLECAKAHYIPIIKLIEKGCTVYLSAPQICINSQKI